ncbi:hypothetical protein DID88_001355 [Monilinia fructigena]|uniref:Transporter n=1 Tax=Monilinia fructigena TaxID=38457 RepID=A0A395J3P1_9HELO|nr:hypothetical protein DID88_001355 [Monilinia fructigena]
MGSSDSAADGTTPVFLGALQASLTVLLTISYGVVASRFNLLKVPSTRDISKVAVRLFLPALLITSVGEELRADTAYRYVPVLIWALVYTLSSIALGIFLKRVFKFPAWCVPAISFNNTTALPLLLVQALDTAGILSSLTMSDSDTSTAVLKRAKSYFLASSMVGNSLTFAFGPKLLDDEEDPEESDEDSKPSHTRNFSNGHLRSETDEEYANPTNSDGRTAEQEEEYENEISTLLPQLPQRITNNASKAAKQTKKEWKKIPQKCRNIVITLYSFISAPLLGALIGALLGLIPPLHRAFFASPQSGGIFKAWLTTSVKNIGELFAALQLVVVGAKLSPSLLRMKRGESSGKLPYSVFLVICFIRFVLWPVISIAVIYIVAKKTQWLDKDPILWFVLMLMPVGPSATNLTALADVSGEDEEGKRAITKFVTVVYAVSPLIVLRLWGV